MEGDRMKPTAENLRRLACRVERNTPLRQPNAERLLIEVEDIAADLRSMATHAEDGRNG